MNKINELKTNTIWKLILKYSIPSIIASLIHALYNIVDRMYIGKFLGKEALAGVTLTFPVFILSIAIGVLISSGASAVISIKLGEKDLKGANKTLGNTIMLFVSIGILVTLVIWPLIKPLLEIIGSTPTTIQYAKDYLLFFIPFMLFDFLAMGTNGVVRSEGNPNRAMMIAASGALINIALDPIFIFVFDWGVSGIAIATSIARIFSAGFVIWHFVYSDKSNLKLRLQDMRFDFQIVKSIVIIGFSPFLMMLATTFVTVFINRKLSEYGGDNALSSLGAISSVFMMVEIFLYGLMNGTQPIVGYNYGAKLKMRVIESMKFAYMFSIGVSLLGLLIIFSFSDQLISIFSKEDIEFIATASIGLKIFMSMIPFVGIHMMSVMYFQATGQALKSVILNLSRKAVFYLPALFLLPLHFGLNGVWSATPTADVLSSLLAILFIAYEYKFYRNAS